MNLFELSYNLLYSVKLQENYSEYTYILSKVDLDELKETVQTDEEKKAFWINIYNAHFLILSSKGIKSIFKYKGVAFQGYSLALDDIEHGILRKSKYKFGMGYIKGNYSKDINALAVDKLDPRMHFALNCGTISCPPIAFYTLDKIDFLLEEATKSFILAQSEIKDKKLYISKMFLFYLGDFGGKEGIKKLHSKVYNMNLNHLKIKYKTYNFTPKLRNFN